MLRLEGWLQTVAQSCPKLSFSSPCSHWLMTVKKRKTLGPQSPRNFQSSLIQQYYLLVDLKKYPSMFNIKDKNLGKSGLPQKSRKGIKKTWAKHGEQQKDGA